MSVFLKCVHPLLPPFWNAIGLCSWFFDNFKSRLRKIGRCDLGLFNRQMFQ